MSVGKSKITEIVIEGLGTRSSLSAQHMAYHTSLFPRSQSFMNLDSLEAHDSGNSLVLFSSLLFGL